MRRAPRTQTLQQDILGVRKLLQGEAGKGQISEWRQWSFENRKGSFNNCPAEVSRGPDPWVTEHAMGSLVMTWGSRRDAGCFRIPMATVPQPCNMPVNPAGLLVETNQ